MTTTTETTQGPSWLALKPAHFDARLLPARHRKPEPEGLFSVADVAPETPRKPAAPTQLDGQMDMFEGMMT
jgi:hypothetical protein